MQRLLSGLLLELDDLEVAYGHDPRKLGHFIEESSQVVEVAVNLDLDRLGYNYILLRVIARAEPHHDHSRITSIVLEACEDVCDLTLLRQKDLELFILNRLAGIQGSKFVDALGGD